MEILETKTDIGLIRDRNEDSVLALRHPRNKNIILLIAADGMGGRDFGDVASNYITNSIKRWFINKSVNILNNLEKIDEQLNKYIKTLNKNLVKKYGKDKLGTTLTMAIRNERNTLVVNVGDSRTYVYRGRKLLQVTEDDSDVWDYFKYGGVKKDHLRFFASNNIITACIGICDELCIVSSRIIKNDYDMILLFTDGVTDNITDVRIKKIIKTSKREYILNNIVNEAVYVDQHFHIPLYLKKKKYMDYIIPFCGRDNASGVIYIR
jgi:protein phosphatase